MCNMELELIKETLPLTTNNAKKYQRSVTLASQLSMGNEITNEILLFVVLPKDTLSELVIAFQAL